MKEPDARLWTRSRSSALRSSRSGRNWIEERMTAESDLREKLAACARIYAMQGMLGLFGHVSAYDPEAGKIFITPGMGSDKAQLRATDMVVMDLDGKVVEGDGRPPVAWP